MLTGRSTKLDRRQNPNSSRCAISATLRIFSSSQDLDRIELALQAVEYEQCECTSSIHLSSCAELTTSARRQDTTPILHRIDPYVPHSTRTCACTDNSTPRTPHYPRMGRNTPERATGTLGLARPGGGRAEGDGGGCSRQQGCQRHCRPCFICPRLSVSLSRGVSSHRTNVV